MTLAVKLGLVVGAYLLGSVPFGLVLTRLFTGQDVRQVGSGNIGASNVSRAAGKKVGILTLVLDAAKASLPMLLAERLLAGEGAAAAESWAVLVGLAAFAGHLYPVWLGFKGGKGVATALGVFLVLAPVPALLALVAFAVGYGTTRVAAVGDRRLVDALPLGWPPRGRGHRAAPPLQHRAAAEGRRAQGLSAAPSAGAAYHSL
jgi:glycerol-3-phosphate acyltransferase PlsY